MKKNLTGIIILVLAAGLFVMARRPTSPRKTSPSPATTNTAPTAQELPSDAMSHPLAQPQSVEWKPPVPIRNFHTRDILTEDKVLVLKETPPGVVGVQFGEGAMLALTSQLRGTTCNGNHQCVIFPNGQMIQIGDELRKRIPPIVFTKFP